MQALQRAAPAGQTSPEQIIPLEDDDFKDF
jgi:hypothetical protein